MDAIYRTVFGWIRLLFVSYFISGNRVLVDAETLVFCNVTNYVTKSLNETGQILSPEVMNQDDDYCHMDMFVCRGCRVQLVNITSNSCLSRYVYVDLEKRRMLFPLVNLASQNGDFVKGGNPLRLSLWKIPEGDICKQQGGIIIDYRILRPEMTYIRRQGTTGDWNTIRSPNFPTRYLATGDVVTYQLVHTGSGFVRLIFTDWCMPEHGVIKIYLDGLHSDGKALTYNNRSVRPIVVSTGRVLIFDFNQALENTGDWYLKRYVGFKAKYEFVAESSWPEKPTLVGNKVLDTDLEGEIRFTHSHRDVVDYVWMLRKPSTLATSSLKLRVDTTMNIDSLEIRRGPTSDGELVSLENLTAPFTIYEESGFYVHLRHSVQPGTTTEFSAVFIWFSKYTDKLCARHRYDDNMFSCPNTTHCLSKRLFCDGISHCDDGSDESGCDLIQESCRFRHICPNETRVICFNMCDGINDCEDGSDEMGCAPTNRTTKFSLSYTSTAKESTERATTTDIFNHSVCNDCNSYTYSVLVIVVLLALLSSVIVISSVVIIVFRRKRQQCASDQVALQEEEQLASSGVRTSINYGVKYTKNSNDDSSSLYDSTTIQHSQDNTTQEMPTPPLCGAGAKSRA